LGSLSLSRYGKASAFDWKLFRKDIHLAVRFLDNVIDLNYYPVSESGKITRKNRKIGLGVMGFADLLLEMNIPYSSPEARAFGEKVMSFLDREAKIASSILASERGAFPHWKGSMWERLGYPKLRNATVSTVAPTGTISLIAGVSSGIEPIFSSIYYRNVLSGKRLKDVHPKVEEILKRKDLEIESLTEEQVGQHLGRAWTPAQSLSVQDHVKMQAVFQRHSDSAVSKTINLSASATVQAVEEAYLLAFELGCKGITVYRDQSRPTQVLEKDPTCLVC
jgi:ribonucleoside-diphosphate reductase alpha chain